MAETSAKRDVVGFYWVYDDGTGPRRSVSQNADAITDLSPTWLSVVDANGTVLVHKDPKLLALAREKGIRILPLIANEGFKPEPFHSILVSPAKRARLASRILEILDSLEYCQGINLDFEGLAPKDRPLYSAFLAELAAKLHPRNYLISIDVPSKTRDVPDAEWSGAFDYWEIGRYCDQVMIMTYDEHWSAGSPGPIASVDFVEKCLKYTLGIIPREKVYLGIPFYGYDWPESGRARGLFHRTALKLASRHKADVRWDETAKAPWFCYQDKSGTRTCWFENKESLAAKLDLGSKYDVAGICIWSLGDEDPGSWDVIRKFRERTPQP